MTEVPIPIPNKSTDLLTEHINPFYLPLNALIAQCFFFNSPGKRPVVLNGIRGRMLHSTVVVRISNITTGKENLFKSTWGILSKAIVIDPPFCNKNL